MKTKKAPLILIAATYLIYRGFLLAGIGSHLAISIFLLPIAVLLFSLSVKRKLSFKSWFLKNPLFAKYSTQFETDLAGDEFQEYLKSVMESSELYLADQNKSTNELLFVTKSNFYTWGEYVYVNTEKIADSEKIKVKIVSSTIFGSSSWNRNELNIIKLISNYEKSLAV